MNEPPTVSTPPDHCCWHCLHVFTSASNPCTTALPYYTPSPSHPAPSASQPLYPPTQKFLLLILTSPGTTARVLFFGWWGIPSVDWWSHSGNSGYWYMKLASKAGWEHIVVDALATCCWLGVVEDGPLAADKEGWSYVRNYQYTSFCMNSSCENIFEMYTTWSSYTRKPLKGKKTSCYQESQQSINDNEATG